MSCGRSVSILWLAVLTVVAVVFSFGVTGGHISMDDWGYVYGCPFVRDGLTANNVVRAFTVIGYDAFWMPLTYVTYMCDITFFGGGWPVNHGVNVILHVANTLLVAFFLRSLLVAAIGIEGRRAAVFAAVGALVWAIHPMRAEAVTYVASRKELLWSFFALAGLLGWMRSLADGQLTAYAVSVICCLFACLSKPTAVCFPVLAYLVEVLRSRRWRPARPLRYVPFFIVALVVGVIVLYAQSNPIDADRLDVFGETFAWRLLNAGVGFGMHIWHAIMPTGVYFDYRAVFGGCPLNLGLGLSMLSLSAAALASTVIAFRRDRDVCRALTAMTIWFFVALAPVSGVMGTVNGDHAYADRYTYLPFVGVTAVGLVVAARCRGRLLSGLAALAAVGVMCEAVISVGVVQSFENDFTAFSRTLERDPEHWRALRVVGNEYCARLGRMDEGVRMLERSLAVRPSQRTAESLAYVLSIRGASGDFARVRELCGGVAREVSKDRHGMMLDAMGTVCLREGRDADAVGFYQASLKADRRNYSDDHTRLNLALALANCGRRREAIELLARLSRSRRSGVKACCARLLVQLESEVAARFAWRADPF